MVDGIDLVFQALLDFCGVGFLCAVAGKDALLADFHQVVLAGGTVRGGELRVFFRGGGVELDGDVAALRDAEGVVAGLGDVLEDGAHFLRRLEMDFRGVAHPAFVDDHGAGADADHHIVGLVVGAVEEMDIVGGDDGELELPRKFDELGHHGELRFEAVVVEFHEGVFLSEDVAEFGEGFERLAGLAFEQPFVDRTGDAAGQADDAFRMGAEDFPVHAGLAVVHAIEMADGGELGEVFPAFVGLGEQGEVGCGLAVEDFLFLLEATRGEVDLAAEDGFHPRFFAGLIEVDGSVEVAVVGHCHSGHAELSRARRELLGAYHSIEEGVGGVKVEVDE